jgi:hypothetical protein
LDQPWWGSRETLALTISEAATICEVRRRSIRRRHQAGDFPHAFRDADGAWRIPLNDLVTAGLEPHQVEDPEEPRIVSAASSQIERLRTEVAVLRERVRALEIIARERGERVSDLRTVLRMLPAPREPVDDVSPPQFDHTIREPAEELPQPPIEEPPQPPIEEPSQLPIEEPAPSPAAELVSPFGAPAWAAPSISSAPLSPSGTAPSARLDLPDSSAQPVEPIVILPDSSESEPVPSDEAPESGDELPEDPMSMWWPTPTGRSRLEDGPDFPLSVPDEWRDVASEAARREEMSDEVPVPFDPAGFRGEPPLGGDSDPVAPAPPTAPETAAYSNGESFGEPYDESSYDWMDADFGRAPRHLRRRLGRFFRRSRRPR